MSKPKPLKLDVPQYDYVERGAGLGYGPVAEQLRRYERLWFYWGGFAVGFFIAAVIFA